MTSKRPSVALGWDVQIALINRVISDTRDICAGNTIPIEKTVKSIYSFEQGDM